MIGAMGYRLSLYAHVAIFRNEEYGVTKPYLMLP